MESACSSSYSDKDQATVRDAVATYFGSLIYIFHLRIAQVLQQCNRLSVIVLGSAHIKSLLNCAFAKTNVGRYGVRQRASRIARAQGRLRIGGDFILGARCLNADRTRDFMLLRRSD